MCGISGTINFSKGTIEKQIQSLLHRGPDEQNYISIKNLNLVHTRLSIQDVSHGQQPFKIDDFIIIFNGEIYNHNEIRKKYLSNIHFRTSSDTETLLQLYIKYSEDMYQYLDGMFAFCIYDQNKNKIILSRDRAGKKPLYLYKDNKKLAFSSELNTLKAICNLEIDNEAIYSYLRCGFFYSELTAYKNVDTISAGIHYEIDLTSLAITKKRYFNILEYYKKPINLSENEALTTIDNLLHKSIKNRLLSSELEVGAFLSGGIDSSLIVAIAQKYTKHLKTFTVKFEDSFDESHLARLTANQYKTQHFEINISMDLKNDIETILYNYGQPFMDSSAIPSYYVSQEAKKYVTVILNGDGADEIFGGYRRYVPFANNLIKVSSYFSWLKNVLAKPHDKKSIYNYVFRMLQMSSKEGLEQYLSATNDIFEDEYTFNNNRIFSKINELIVNIQEENISSLSKMLYLDFNMILFSDLLVKMDIATMAHSLEGRSPFLSKDLLEFVPRLQDCYKVKGTTTKYILRELSKKYLSNELITQPKRGFEVPLKKWVNNEFKSNIFDLLNHNSYSATLIDKTYMEKLLLNKLNISEEKRAKMLWTMYCLEVWYKNQ